MNIPELSYLRIFYTFPLGFLFVVFYQQQYALSITKTIISILNVYPSSIIVADVTFIFCLIYSASYNFLAFHFMKWFTLTPNHKLSVILRNMKSKYAKTNNLKDNIVKNIKSIRTSSSRSMNIFSKKGYT